MPIGVVLEETPRRTFASALDWPGWSRGAKTPDDALASLLAFAPRYGRVTERAGLELRPPKTTRGLLVVERLVGGAGTEFGVPGVAAASESVGISPARLTRLLALLEAAWATFDEVASAAEGRLLRLGPRGGGRQVPKIVAHVREAERAYVHQLGARAAGTTASMDDLRRAFLDAVRRRATDEPLPDPNRVRRPWEPRYAIRRSAWHVLDHAWEIEDRLER